MALDPRQKEINLILQWSGSKMVFICAKKQQIDDLIKYLFNERFKRFAACINVNPN